MTENTDRQQPAPAGFSLHFRRSPLTEPWQPLYSRKIDGVVQIGLWVRLAHCNGRELLHGGLVSALADNAMGLSCSLQRVAHDKVLAAKANTV